MDILWERKTCSCKGLSTCVKKIYKNKEKIHRKIEKKNHRKIQEKIQYLSAADDNSLNKQIAFCL